MSNLFIAEEDDNKLIVPESMLNQSKLSILVDMLNQKGFGLGSGHDGLEIHKKTFNNGEVYYQLILTPHIIMRMNPFGELDNISNNCQNPTNGKAVLVAYKVAKHSRLWLQNPNTKQIYNIGIGKKREPNINLGDTINVQYCNGEIIIDKYKYVKKENRERRFIHLNGFDYLN